jgi:UDP-N-acetylmuramoylalanine--D-glutamate ligase
MQLAGKKVLVVGLGRSGLAAARMCRERGARVTVTDLRVDPPGLDTLPADVARELGRHDERSFVGADVIVLSPGVPPLHQVVAARAAGVTVTGELELASRFVSATLVAITGTNGKSTTTSLTGDILAATGRPTFVGGNLGVPLAEAVGTPAAGAGGICVVEASSFQLETVEHFRPLVSVLLNITADHLDRYADLEAYAVAKTRIFAAQGASDFAVINEDDAMVERLTRGLSSRRLSLSTRRPLREGGWIEGDSLCLRLPGAELEHYPAQPPGLIGRHNQENALASLLAARLAGATHQQALQVLMAFRPLAHRMELVAEVDGVAFFDDSKGTNVGAVVAALSGFPRPVVLIAGGRDKGGAYEPLARAMKDVGRGAVVIGEAATRIATALSPVVPVERAATMEEAVQRAAALARPGDAVVLSPACSSFDMFRNYEHRAQVFRAAVDQHAAGPGGQRSTGAQ